MGESRCSARARRVQSLGVTFSHVFPPSRDTCTGPHCPTQDAALEPRLDHRVDRLYTSSPDVARDGAADTICLSCPGRSGPADRLPRQPLVCRAMHDVRGVVDGLRIVGEIAITD